MARLKDIVVDSLHPAALARFWASALDGYAVRAYDDAEIAQLAERGLTPETDPAVAVDGDGPTIFFQQTDEVKAVRNRIHLDIATLERGPEIERLEALGARVRDEHDDVTVMLDPESNEFCVVEVDADRLAELAARGARSG